jgi:hypothetical protein
MLVKSQLFLLFEKTNAILLSMIFTGLLLFVRILLKLWEMFSIQNVTFINVWTRYLLKL